MHDPPRALLFAPLLLESLLPLRVLVLAHNGVEFGGNLEFLLDFLEGLDTRLRQLVIMALMVSIRYDVEFSGLNSAVPNSFDSLRPDLRLIEILSVF